MAEEIVGSNNLSNTSNDQQLPDPKPEDTATTKAELLERKYAIETNIVDDERPAKKIRTDGDVSENPATPNQRVKGQASIKSE